MLTAVQQQVLNTLLGSKATRNTNHMSVTMARLAELMRENGAAIDIGRLREYIKKAVEELKTVDDDHEAKMLVAVKYTVPFAIDLFEEEDEVWSQAFE